METKTISVTAYPWASVYGNAEVPAHLNEDEQRMYLEAHWDEIQFGNPELDYTGAEFEINENGRILELKSPVPPKEGFKYILKVYDDKYAYKEEYIRAFPIKKEGEEALKAMVEAEYGAKWDEIPKKLGLSKRNKFKPDHVAIPNGDGHTVFFIVEKLSG